MKSAASPPCPCGGAAYVSCCEPLHRGSPAANAEKLMRSRYSAYVLALSDYLLSTWDETTRPAALDLEADRASLRWLGLKVLRHQQISDDDAIVEFVARHRQGGGAAARLHEISRFRRRDGRWYYLDGSFPDRAGI